MIVASTVGQSGSRTEGVLSAAAQRVVDRECFETERVMEAGVKRVGRWFLFMGVLVLASSGLAAGAVLQTHTLGRWLHAEDAMLPGSARELARIDRRIDQQFGVLAMRLRAMRIELCRVRLEQWEARGQGPAPFRCPPPPVGESE